MKLLPASSLVLLAKLATANNGYSSTCTDDGFLEITIPYANQDSANLLSAVAEDCTLTGASSDNHEFSWADSYAVLRININNCGLNRVLYSDPVLRDGGNFYMATANVTMGIHDDDQDRDLIFYNALLGAECGTKVDYTVTFDYAQTIQYHDQTGCHEHSPEGECIVAAYESYNFLFKEYTGNDYATEAADDAVHQASSMIYLQIEATDLPDNKKFSVRKCDFVDTVVGDDGAETVERYPMFNAESGTCTNRYIDLSFGYDFVGNQGAQIAHRLFLLSRGDQDSYALECQVKVCDKNDHDSDCNSYAACLDGENAGQDYACVEACADGENCSADDSNNAVCAPAIQLPTCNAVDYRPEAADFILAPNNQPRVEGYTQISRSFIESGLGSSWLTIHYRQFQYYQGHMTATTGDAAFITSDMYGLQFSNGQWIRYSQRGADSSTFDFTACADQDSGCANYNADVTNYQSFLVGCSSNTCSPSQFDWATVRYGGQWSVSSWNENMASIQIKDTHLAVATGCGVRSASLPGAPGNSEGSI